MKSKLVLYALTFFFLFNIFICAHAQDITPGYYRVKNVGLATYGGTILKKTGVKEDCYAYVANGTYHVITTAGYGQNIPSMLLWAGLEDAIVSPQTVIYIAKTGDNYNLEAQGTSVSQMTSYKINVNTVSGTTDTYTLSTTISGVGASLWAFVKKTGIFDKDGNNAYPSNYIATTSPQPENSAIEAYRQWKIVPISASSDNYVAVKACLKVKDEEDETRYKYYAPYYASYPFRLVSPGMKAYYVSSITDKKYTLQEITSEVIPGATPVIIECPSDNPADCKIEPLQGKFGSISDNKLKGVYFCNLEMSPVDYPDCRTEFKAASMRVWAVKDDKLVLTNTTERVIYNTMYSGFSGYWLRPNESYLADVPSTAAAELVAAGKATTISFDTDGGTEIGDISGGEGEPVTAPASPTKTGYTFTGWNPALPQVFPEEDLTVTAQWQINKHTLTYYVDNEVYKTIEEVEYDTPIIPEKEPGKEGYTFSGWSTIPSTMPDNDVNVTGTFSINQYTITFNSNGGSAVNPIKQDYQSVIAKPNDPIREGYTFLGWNPALPDKMPLGGFSTTAQWKINQYTITFDTDGGSEVKPITQDYGTAVTAPANPTKEGFVFAGWDKKIPGTMPAENITIKALWDKLYTLTFDTDGGSDVASITAVSGTTIVKPDDPTKTGYTFNGWTPSVPYVMPEGDMTVKATWLINKHKVTFKNYNGDTWQEEILDYGAEIKLPETNPTKEGGVFKNWSPTPAKTVPDEDVVYTATFDDSEYTITFDTDGGLPVPSPITEFYNRDITDRTKDIQNPQKEGYTFQKWEPAIPSVITGDLTIKAIWEANKYTITFDTDGGSEVNPITQEYLSAITKPDDPIKEGNTFLGWDPALPDKMPLNGLSVTARWLINKHTLTYYVDGKEYKKFENVEYNTAITPEAEPKKDGYTFSGWSTIPSTMPDNDVNVTGTFSINQYTITFNSNGGSAVNPIKQDYQSVIAKPDDPIREGYTFLGWDPALPEKMPLGGFSTTAQWQINKHTLTYRVDNEVYKTIEEVEYDTPIIPEKEPGKEGYTFSGWSTIPSTMPDRDVTISGTFAINKHTVTFDTDGGSEVADITQDYGTKIKVDAPTKKDYDFVGWSPALPETMPDEDLQLKALWGPKTVEVTYPLNENWTWVSFFMINEDMSTFDKVLSSLKWTSADEIKGADAWAIYSAKKKKWVGTMDGFMELSMYKIHSSYSGQELKLNGSYINSKADHKVGVEKGWNYLPYLSLSTLPISEALQDYVASEGDILKYQAQSAFYSGGKWQSTDGLNSMEPGKGYMLYRSADDKVEFTYPIALVENSNNSRVMRFDNNAQRFSSNMNVFATVEGVIAVPGDSIVAFAVDGVRGGATIDDEGKACLTIIGDNNTDIYLALMHNNTVVASAKAPISYASDDIVGTYANPTAIEFVEGSEAWGGDYNIVAIYTMDGKHLPSTDIKTLTTGLYIIKYETLSDNNSNTGGCRVFRVVR